MRKAYISIGALNFIGVMIVTSILVKGCSAEDHKPRLHNTNTIEKHTLGHRPGIGTSQDKCFKWALGENYGTISKDFDEIWNERHGDIFILKGTDSFHGAIERIEKVCFEKCIINEVKTNGKE